MRDTPTPTYRCGGSAGLAPRAYFPRDAHLLPDYPFRQNGVRAPGPLKNIRDPTRVQPQAKVLVKGVLAGGANELEALIASGELAQMLAG